MEITLRKLKLIREALSYGMMFSKDEAETAEFAMLLIEIDGDILRKIEHDKKKSEHDKMGCPFNYCGNVPKCKGKCEYSN